MAVFKSLKDLYFQPGKATYKPDRAASSEDDDNSPSQDFPAMYGDAYTSSDCGAPCACNESHACTRPDGHSGDHEAHWNKKWACCDTWHNEADDEPEEVEEDEPVQEVDSEIPF